MIVEDLDSKTMVSENVVRVFSSTVETFHCPECETILNFYNEECTEPYGYVVETWKCPKCGIFVTIK